MYPHSRELIQTFTDDRLRHSDRRRLILTALADDTGDRRGLIARFAGFRPAARRAGTVPAR